MINKSLSLSLSLLYKLVTERRASAGNCLPSGTSCKGGLRRHSESYGLIGAGGDSRG